jgi:hypothetical protein
MRADLGIINSTNYGRIFDNETFQVPDERNLLQGIPRGSFLGFLRGRTLIHAMIYIDGQTGAGTANGCIFSAARAGWESINLVAFFREDRPAGVTMIARPVNEQII